MINTTYRSLIRMVGNVAIIAEISKNFSDPSGVLNPNMFSPLPDAISNGNWENLGRHWQKTYWGFEGYPDINHIKTSSLPEENFSSLEFHLTTVGGHPTPLLETIARAQPNLTIQIAWCPANAPEFEKHGCSFVNSTNRSDEAYAMSCGSLGNLADSLQAMWGTTIASSVGYRPEYVPLSPPAEENFDAVLETTRRLIFDAFRMPPEALSKETGYAVYTKVVELVKDSPSVKAYLAIADRVVPGAEGVQGDGGELGKGTGDLAATTDTSAPAHSEDDPCGGFCAPC